MAALMTSMCVFRNVKQINRLLACQSDILTNHNRQYGFTQLSLHTKTNLLKRLPKIHCLCRHTQLRNASANPQTKVLSKEMLGIEINDTEKTQSGKENEEKEQTKEESKGRIEKIFGSWTKFGFVFFGCWSTFSGFALIYIWGKPLLDAEGNEIKDEYSDYSAIQAYIMRTYKEVFYQVKITQEPSRKKLLPDPLKYPYIQPKYTLVLEMTDVLVHPDWTYGTGWRFKKRPGIEYFLRAVGPPLFEVVVYTKEQGMTADPIITKIDPENYIMYRLYRDATRYIEGNHVKDLSYLNRDLSKVIFIDWNKDAFKLNSENGFCIPKWTGEDGDTMLGELADFLRALAVSKVDDVRPVLQYYSQFENPMAQFHENQAKLKEEQDKLAQFQKTNQKKSLLPSTWRLK